MTRLRRALVLVLAATAVVLGGCDRAEPSCDPLIYGDLPCL
jgi:hypothetical protein